MYQAWIVEEQKVRRLRLMGRRHVRSPPLCPTLQLHDDTEALRKDMRALQALETAVNKERDA